MRKYSTEKRILKENRQKERLTAYFGRPLRGVLFLYGKTEENRILQGKKSHKQLTKKKKYYRIYRLWLSGLQLSSTVRPRFPLAQITVVNSVSLNLRRKFHENVYGSSRNRYQQMVRRRRYRYGSGKTCKSGRGYSSRQKQARIHAPR